MTTNRVGINAVLFDYGGVLMRTVDPRPRRELDRRFGLEPYGVDRLVFGHSLWDQAQLGIINSDAIWADIGRQLGLDPDGLRSFRELFWAGDRLDTELVALMGDLKTAGYRIGLLSNNPVSLRQRVDQLFPGVFDAIVVSGCEGVMKPDPRIFELALGRLDLQASEVVFVDDYPRNVVAARQSGLAAVHFRGLAPLRRELRELGLPVPEPALEPLTDVRAVIFDWGGVVERLPDEAHFARWEQRLGLEPHTLRSVLWGQEYRLLEVGQITAQEFARSVADHLSLPGAVAADSFIKEFYTNDWLNEATLTAVRGLRERYRVGLLSNAFPGQDGWIRELYGIDLDAEFDVYINSACVGLRKPDPAIFELALSRLGVEPGQAIFLDDGIRNVDAAREVGINTVQFVDPATSLPELEALLGRSW
jgi:HAD superfamily hydrolase (TIGR01509 family)